MAGQKSTRRAGLLAIGAALLVMAGCGAESPDAGPADAGPADAGPADAVTADAGDVQADTAPTDTTTGDSASPGDTTTGDSGSPGDTESAADAPSADAPASDVPASDAPGPDVASPDVAIPDVPSADTEDPDIPDADLVDAPSSDGGDTGLGDTGLGDTGLSDTAAPDSQPADTASLPDAASLDAASPDANSGDASSGDAAPSDAGAAWSGGFTHASGSFASGLKVPVPKMTQPDGSPGFPAVTGGLLQDLDGDGDTDLLVWSQGGHLHVHERLASGAFALTQLKVPGATLLAALAIRQGGVTRTALLGDRIWWLERKAAGWVVGGALGDDVTQSPNVGERWGGTVADIDRDGLLDLLVARFDCDKPRLPEAWIAQGDGTWKDRAADWKLGVAEAHWQPMVADVDDDGDPDLIWMHDGCAKGSTTQFFAAQQARAADGTPVFVRSAPHPQFAFPKPKNPFSSPMGGVAADFDGDGHLDVLLADGGMAFSEATAKKLAPPEMWPYLHLVRTKLLLGQGAKPWVDVSKAWGLHSLVDPVKKMDMVGWGTAALDFDRDGKPDALIAHGEDYDAWAFQQRGPQRPTLLANTGKGFVEVNAGLPQVWSAQSLSVGDLDDDGDQDVLLGGVGAAPQVYRNAVVHGRHAIRVRLEGVVSNPLGIGARVFAKTTAGQRFVELGATGAFGAQHEWVADIGIGTAKSASVQVLWPTGRLQDYGVVQAGTTVTLKEAAWLTLSSRVLPAKGGVVVKAQAFDAKGQAKAAKLALDSFPAGQLSWQQPWVCDKSGSCQGTLAQAKGAKAGQRVRLRLSVDGKALAIWPAVLLE